METLWSVQREINVLLPDPVIPMTAIKMSLGCGWKASESGCPTILPMLSAARWMESEVSEQRGP